MKKIFVIILCLCSLFACKTQEQNPSTLPEKPHTAAVPSPPAIIYKTTHDYSHNVPVILSEDKQEIVSFPHPMDIYMGGELALPTPLRNGFWLDNRGINENVAFLSFTYEEYAALTEVPSLIVLKNSIIDKNPIKQMWNCGPRHHYKDIAAELNEIIKHKELKERCKQIK